MAAAAPPTITLTPEEETVRKVLVDVATEIEENSSASGNAITSEPLTLRFTGGWVRDKLLGQQSHDIDVGINKMTGFDFANRLSQFLTERVDQYNIPARSIHKIESNPEKSKHLETATTKIFSLDVDFVNLRSETYTADSRIPQMEFGTPLQDALRRDACVNALFYNLHTQQVEDFTEKGLQDMADKLMRTPLAPFETFRDDPLRVLRLIRFASRLEFTIVPEALEAMESSEIREKLATKISRERVGTELEKMLRGPHPAAALSLLYNLKLFTSIFTPPAGQFLPDNLPTEHMAHATAVLSYLVTNSDHLDYPHLRLLLQTPNDQYLGWILGALTPFAGHMFPGVDKKKNIPAAATAAREGFKADNKVIAIVVSSYRNSGEIQKIVAQTAKASRGQMGMLIRDLGADWKSPVLCSLVLESLPYWKENEAVPSASIGAHAVLLKYERFLARVEELGLLEAYTFRPIINGKDLKNILEQQKAGIWMTTALRLLMEWQMDHPEEGVEVAEAWVRSEKDRLVPSDV